MDSFKYLTGQWLAENCPEFEWQKDYHDHIIRNSEDGDEHVVYIACNPVRPVSATTAACCHTPICNR